MKNGHCAQTCLDQVNFISHSFKSNITWINISQEEKRKMEAAI